MSLAMQVCSSRTTLQVALSYSGRLQQLITEQKGHLSLHVWLLQCRCAASAALCAGRPAPRLFTPQLTYMFEAMQVCSFRCIVSYESALLQDFSLCILQKNNCLGLSADIPAQPDVQPMTHFKGQPLSHEQAGVQVRCHQIV